MQDLPIQKFNEKLQHTTTWMTLINHKEYTQYDSQEVPKKKAFD